MNIVLSRNNSIGAAKNHVVPIPSYIPVGMIIAVQPSRTSVESYWLAVVTSKRSNSPLVYNVRYYNQKKVSAKWQLMRGPGAYGYVPHGAVIGAGVELNNDGSMKKSSLDMIQKSLSQVV